MKKVYILSAVRTPIGKFGGAFTSIPATVLGGIAIRGAVQRAGVDPARVQQVIMGNVIAANLGQAPARQAALHAGLSNSCTATTVNKVCASGMKSVAMACQSIQLGDADLIVAGGMENMSNVPFYVEGHRWGHKYGDTRLIDGLSKDGLSDPYDQQAMGLAAEHCASECSIGREEQDAYAMESYRRSQHAWEKGYFDQEIVIVDLPQKKGAPIQMNQDEEPWNVKFEKIPMLSSAFKKDGTVTAANASTMNDGAAALVICSEEFLQQTGLQPVAEILSYADAEQEPIWFTTAPSLALPTALKKAGLSPDEIGAWEINEAFSVVAIENAKRLGIRLDRLNLFGGAVSLGHPLGCSGARILVTLLSVLHHSGHSHGAAGICNGGGGASAMVLRRCN
ncbi:MAG: acetyl-CoA C-acyltransferase [Bacteroidota bacterium]